MGVKVQLFFVAKITIKTIKPIKRLNCETNKKSAGNGGKMKRNEREIIK